MNRRFISVLLFAFLVAGSASVVLYRLVIGRMKTSAPIATSSLVVASKNLEVGTVITDADVRISEWPGATPQGAIVKVADAVGRGITAPIYVSEPVTESRLGTRGSGGGLAATIPAGMRAMAIKVNEVVGVAGFVVAGTHVDVLVSGSVGNAEGSGGDAARTLLQNVLVLSAGQDFKKDNEAKPASAQVVNLLVTPEQAEMLSLASGQMKLQLVLRNPMDVVVAAIPEVTLANLLGGPATPVATRPAHITRPLTVTPVKTVVVLVPPAPELAGMEIISGGKRTEIQLQKATAR